MKTPSTDLYQLIKSLTAPEKKYFKQYSARYSEDRENTYTLLFDAIDTQNEYDEAAIRQKFKDYDFIKQLSVAKNYLYERILDALVNMHVETDDSLKLGRLISRFELLKKKNLMNAALNAYEKAEKFARESSKLTLMPHITRQKNQIVSRIEKHSQTGDYLANSEEALRHGKVMVNYMEYELLSIKANILFGTPSLNTDPTLMQQLDELMRHPLFEDESTALSMQAWFFYSRTKYRYLMIKGRMEEGFKLLRHSIGYMQKFPAKTYDWQVTNYRFYCDLAYVSFYLRKYEECRKLINDIQGFIELKYAPLHSMIHENFLNRLRYSAETGLQMDETIALWEEKRKWWEAEKNGMEQSNYKAALFAAMKLYFLKQDWKNVILMFNELNSGKFLWDMHIRARYFWLMLQFEIDNIEILKNQAQNTGEWFKKNNVAAELDKTIISYFKKLPSVAGKEARIKLFTQFKSDIEKTYTAEQVDTYYDLIKWIESKIESVSLAQIIKREAEAAVAG